MDSDTSEAITGVVQETYIHISWAWISLPLVALSVTNILLFVSIFHNRNDGRLWKSSTTVMLIHGLGSCKEEELVSMSTLEDISEFAKKTRVRLERTGALSKFVKVS